MMLHVGARPYQAELLANVCFASGLVGSIQLLICCKGLQAMLTSPELDETLFGR